jgi:UMF1 family MFS transporter
MKNRKQIWGWALYDWANSAFATTVMAGFFPIFFKQYWSAGADVNTSTALLGFGNAAASLVVALMAPFLGAFADRSSSKKKLLILFAYTGALMTGALFLVGKGQWQVAVFVYAAGIVGFAGGNIFYDALLPSITDEDNVDMVSGFGFSLGYLGGGLLFLLNVMMTLKPHLFGISDAGMAVRLSFLSVALWWGGFTLFTIVWVPEPGPGRQSLPVMTIIRASVQQVIGTLGKLRQEKTLLLFLLAYWFYIDGVDTIIRMAVDYGLSLGFQSSDLITALLIVQFVGFPAALAFGKLGQRWGPRPAIFLAIGIYIFVTLWGTFMRDKNEFYFLAVTIALAQGGIQALSRSYYSRLIPEDQAAEFYGFYNMLGKFAAILGPVLMGVTGLVARRLLMPVSPSAEEIVAVGHQASRISIASLLILFVIGGTLFLFAKPANDKQ